MKTRKKSQTQIEREIARSLLFALNGLNTQVKGINDNSRYPMKGQWLEASDLRDVDNARYYYYTIMDTLVITKCVEVIRETYGSACTWDYHKITPKGIKHLDALLIDPVLEPM